MTPYGHNNMNGMFKLTKQQIVKMSTFELASCLRYHLNISDAVINNLFREDVDGSSFILMRKKDLNVLNLGDKHIMLCLIFPSANFVNELI